jgi:hypothetical protein
MFSLENVAQGACNQMEAYESHKARRHDMMSLLLLEGVGPLHLQCMLEVAQTQVFSVPPTCQFIGESR